MITNLRRFGALLMTLAVVSLLFGAPAAVSAAAKPSVPSKSVKGKPPVSGQKSALTACSPECYSYAGQKYAGTGLTATKSTFRVARPNLPGADPHSLAETAVQGGIAGANTQNNTVEAGWTVDPNTNGGSVDPFLFVFAWYDDGAGNMVGCEYNGRSPNACGYVDNAANPINAGSNIAADIGTEPAIEIYHYAPSAAWIINYKGVQVGRYPDSLNHSSQFTTANLVQNFGEVASTHTPSCANMGSGNFPNANTNYPTHGTEFKALNIAAGGSYATAAYTGTIQTTPSSWAVYPSGSGEFRFGGPGAGAPNTSPNPCP